MTEKAKKPTPAKKLSFGDAITEVEDILARLEAEDVDIDALGEEVKRAVELITVCREKLARTDKEVRELVAGLDTGEGGKPAPAAESEDLPF